MEWLIAHNMGMLTIIVPVCMAVWAWVTITEKIKKNFKKQLTEKPRVL